VGVAHGSAQEISLAEISPNRSPTPQEGEGSDGALRPSPGRNVFQCTQNAFHHTFEIGVDVRIPESKNLEALRLQKSVANLIRACALEHSMLTAIGFYDESGLERNEVDDVTSDRCLSPEMKAEAFQFAQPHPQFDFLRRKSLAKRAGIFVCQGWSSRKIYTFTCDCPPCQRLLIPSPLWGAGRPKAGRIQAALAKELFAHCRALPPPRRFAPTLPTRGRDKNARPSHPRRKNTNSVSSYARRSSSSKPSGATNAAALASSTTSSAAGVSQPPSRNDTSAFSASFMR
jgi:hypothetical protein